MKATSRAALVLTIAAVASSGCGGGSGRAAAGTTATTAAATTTAASASTDATTTTTAVGPVVDGTHARLVAPAPPVTPRTVADPAQCQTFAAAGHSVDTCATVGPITGLVERDTAAGTLTAWVFRADGPTLTPVLEATSSAGELAAVHIKAADLNGDGVDELVFGFHVGGAGDLLEIDVVDSSGTVVLHRNALPDGHAAVVYGTLVTWAGVFAGGAPQCCPTSYQREVVGYVGGVYHLIASDSVDPSTVPEGVL